MAVPVLDLTPCSFLRNIVFQINYTVVIFHAIVTVVVL